MERCPWAGKTVLYQRYHDEEWGAPVHDDRRHFEFMVLEGAQAGLSWETILRKREGYRQAFAGFDPVTVATFGEGDIERLVADPGIVRNRLKIVATIGNARAFLDIQSRHGSFDAFVWSFVGGRTIHNAWETLGEVPVFTPEAEGLSKELKRSGCRFVGPTVVYATMQACGLVNDHLVTCFRHSQLRQ